MLIKLHVFGSFVRPANANGASVIVGDVATSQRKVLLPVSLFLNMFSNETRPVAVIFVLLGSLSGE